MTTCLFLQSLPFTYLLKQQILINQLKWLPLFYCLPSFICFIHLGVVLFLFSTIFEFFWLKTMQVEAGKLLNHLFMFLFWFSFWGSVYFLKLYSISFFLKWSFISIDFLQISEFLRQVHEDLFNLFFLSQLLKSFSTKELKFLDSRLRENHLQIKDLNQSPVCYIFQVFLTILQRFIIKKLCQCL